MKRPLVDSDFAWAAERLGWDEAMVRAFAEVESRDAGFLESGEPVILFERHIFHRLTGGRFSGSHPDISSRRPGGYGRAGAHQHTRLQRAVELDRDAALKSASWGLFQIMGFNHSRAGFAKLQDFINAMFRSERAQLEAFVSFVLSDPDLVRAGRHRNTYLLAERYNGPAQDAAPGRAQDYDFKLAQALTRWDARLRGRR